MKHAVLQKDGYVERSYNMRRPIKRIISILLAFSLFLLGSATQTSFAADEMETIESIDSNTVDSITNGESESDCNGTHLSETEQKEEPLEDALETGEERPEEVVLPKPISENSTIVPEVESAEEDRHVSKKIVAMAGYDTTAPIVNKVTFTQSVIKPGIVKVTVDVTEKETGIIGINLNFGNDNVSQPIIYHNGTWNNYTTGEWEKSPRPSGIYTLSVSVPSSARSGEWYLNQIDLADQAGNYRTYSVSDTSTKSWVESQGNVINDVSLNVNNGNNILFVKDEFDVEFQRYITIADITTELNGMADGSAAMINFDSNNYTAKKEWFAAIKGTKKNIVFSNDGIQWIFRGQDIINPKDIKLSVAISEMSSSLYGNSSQSLRLQFPANGQLPGKATVRIKADYIYSLNQLSGTLYLYYMNADQSLKLEDNPQYILDGTDHWCEFDMTHNSTFLVSGKKLSTQSPNIKLNKTSLRLGKGKTATLKATIGSADATSQTAAWSSSNTKVAVVNGNGKVTAKNYGTATITVKIKNGKAKTDKCKVTVGYPITYKLKNGKNNNKNPKFYYKEKISLKSPTRKGYLFKGWYSDSKYKKKIKAISAKTTGKITLYAKWEKVSISKVSIISLKNSSSKKAVIKYKKMSGISGYEIMYSTDKKFKKNCKTITTKKVSATLKSLEKKKTYYTKVKAYKMDSAGKKVYGTYSKVTSIKIEK